MKLLDMGIWEMGEGFKNLPDADVWKRPSPQLLSVGEIAAHVAYWEVQSFFGENFDSVLASDLARYYTTSIDTPFELQMTAEEVYNEVKRVHEACKAALEACPHEPDEINSHREGWTWGFTVQYQAFHIAYHTGQIYSVRHLLGHETQDN